MVQNLSSFIPKLIRNGKMWPNENVKHKIKYSPINLGLWQNQPKSSKEERSSYLEGPEGNTLEL